ncbi:MAG: hypothetical protein ABI372_11750 [Ginsengibacter sp.]
MNIILKKLNASRSECSVTIFLKTHRVIPDNEMDSIVLKNLIKDVESRLSSVYESSFVNMMMNRINALAENVDHRLNKESLVLFINENISEYVRLPIPVENRVVIDRAFATRDLIRALHRETSWYLLVLSRDKARLIEAFNDKVSAESDSGFPVININLNPVQRSEAAIASRQTNLIREFFNRVDKQLNNILKENPLPVIICTEESNYSEYLKVTDNEKMIVGNLYGNRMNEKAHHIVEAAWPVIKKMNKEKNEERLAELKVAVNSRNFLIDFNEIWTAVNEGRGKTLFVKQGYFQPAKFENGHIELISKEHSATADVDDIIDEIIEKNLQSNGDAVFINGDELEKFNGLVLVTRY